MPWKGQWGELEMLLDCPFPSTQDRFQSLCKNRPLNIIRNSSHVNFWNSCQRYHMIFSWTLRLLPSILPCFVWVFISVSGFCRLSGSRLAYVAVMRRSDRDEVCVALWTAGQGRGSLRRPDKRLSRWKEEARNYKLAACCCSAVGPQDPTALAWLCSKCHTQWREHIYSMPRQMSLFPLLCFQVTLQCEVKDSWWAVWASRNWVTDGVECQHWTLMAAFKFPRNGPLWRRWSYLFCAGLQQQCYTQESSLPRSLTHTFAGTPTVRTITKHFKRWVAPSMPILAREVTFFSASECDCFALTNKVSLSITYRNFFHCWLWVISSYTEHATPKLLPFVTF